MSKYDAARERRQELQRLMDRHGMGHPDYWAWEREYKRLGKVTGKPRNAISPRCTPDRRPTELHPHDTNAERRDGIRRQNAEVKGVRL